MADIPAKDKKKQQGPRRTAYQRVVNPDHCRRVGTVALGGHCLVCGFDIAPYAGKEVGLAPLESDAKVIICGAGDCFLDFYRALPAQRVFWTSIEAKHFTSFGDHGCFKFVEALEAGTLK